MSEVPALVAEATKKSDLVWIGLGARPYPVWQLWQDGASYVLTGPGEQPAPGLAEAGRCEVTVRSKDNGGRIVTWTAEVSRVAPGSEDWAAVLPALVAGRLNMSDPAAAEARWADSATLLKLTPTGELAELPTGSGAVPPPPSPARTPTRIPFTVGRRRR